MPSESPAPTLPNLAFSGGALGWLKGTAWPSITAIAVLVGFGHSFLAMSGEESLAQVYREIESPKITNLKRTGAVIFVYSLVFTGSVSFLAAALIPDQVRATFYDNLISGIAMHLAGPMALRLAFQAFVVLVGFLILAGAVKTAIVGSNAVLTRVSEDGVLPEWFRQPHKRFGTSYRFLNLIVALQLLTVVLSESAKVSAAQLALMMGEAWGRIEKDDNVRARLVVCKRNGTVETFQLGPHAPPLNEEDLALIHSLWLDAVATLGLQIHHRDVVRTAIEELAGGLSPAARRLWDTAHF